MIEVDADGVVEFTQALVRIPSTNDPGRRERAAADLVEARMREWGWDPVRYEVEPDRPNVVAVVEGGGGDGPTLMFEGHTDVVTEGDLSAWTVDPFGGEIRDGRLWGRGSADMKSGLAATLYATRALQLAGPFPGRIKVCALADEEGLMIGAHHFVSEGLAADVDGAIVAEPEAGEICAVAKGALRLRVDLTGKMAHGAMPQHGRNPLQAVGTLLVGLRALQEELQERHPAHEHLGEVYVTPTVLRAGSEEQVNVIPAVASVFVDVRTIPGVEHKTVADRVAALAAGDGITAEVSVLVDRPPVDVPVSDPVVAALAAAHRAVTGEEPVYGGVPGSTDGTVLTHWGGIPSVVYGPGGKWIAHQADEFVEVAEIVRCARVFAEAARRFLTRDL
ncbi:ArgE/DapE family deacylase [Nonomuraea phyllanthi]|uniref:Probable succinyl-diaminopimelate desuccinylase n=1 Tax=Nonomuraea phyllanthi TaxID=2219224 RepID=A0A5C4VS71_9ACTN|nr:M20 family metallopeptidase [Nonomuraea phyllanthi]KAB8189855.1 ArgE/DapE family deacylase [Nonomuraea phyllanthi]QFY08810.1 ArgE/DapE family deacylase [Nonomuraea phyllanthi]